MINDIVCFSILILFLQESVGYKVKDGPLLNHSPQWLKMCKRSDPKMNECLTNLFTVMFPELAKGISDINVDPFEPLSLNEVSVSKGAGAVVLTGSFYNLTVKGPSNSTPTYTDLNIRTRKLNFGIYFPLLDIKAKYNLKGNILILPLVGNGDCHMVLGGVDTKIKATVTFLRIEDKEVMRIDDMNVSFTLEKIKVKLDNLFNGNKVLGLTVNTFLNQRGLEIVSELEEPIGQSLAIIFKDIINNIFLKMPTDLWLPKEDVTVVKESTNIKKDVS